MKYCPNCGVAVEEGQKFCGECGAKLEFDPLPAEPVYTEDERLKNDPLFKGDQAPAPRPKREDKVPELTLEPDLWGMGAAAVAAAPAEAAKPAEPAAAASAASAVEALPAGKGKNRDIARPVEDFDYEQVGAEYHGPAQGTQGDFHTPATGSGESTNTLPNDYTMSGGYTPAQSYSPDLSEKKLPDETLMLIWSIVLTCLFSVCGIVGLVKTIKARKTMDYAMKYKLLNSAKIWLIVGTVLRVLPFLSELL